MIPQTRPFVIAEEGSLVGEKQARYLDADVLHVRAGHPFPLVVGKLLFAVEGSVKASEVPERYQLVEVRTGSVFPMVISTPSNVMLT